MIVLDITSLYSSFGALQFSQLREPQLGLLIGLAVWVGKSPQTNIGIVVSTQNETVWQNGGEVVLSLLGNTQFKWVDYVNIDSGILITYFLVIIQIIVIHLLRPYFKRERFETKDPIT